ncbi:MAG: protein-glutamate O-methyltransferase CheR [Bacteroidota bacterium]
MITDNEIGILLNDLLESYGYDFNYYSKASLTRRINRLFTLDKFTDFATFRVHLLSDNNYIKRFVEEITVNVTEMFRDSSFYKALRTDILPVLGTHPFIRIWHAGCSTGEEVYSMAILLHEAGLLHKSLLYATDINPGVLEKAKSGIFPLGNMKSYSENYIASGGIDDFSSYYTANYEGGKFNQELREKMIYSTHNLVSDRSFNEFHLIVCRNVLIYFDKELQERVFTLFDGSMGKLAYLALGSKETIKFSDIQDKFTQVGKEKVWRKIK